MSLKDEFAQHVKKPKPSHPKGWEPGFEFDGTRGQITTEPCESKDAPEFDELLKFFGYDPERFEIVGHVHHRAWQQKAGAPFLFYHRATIALRDGTNAEHDVDALLAAVAKRKPRTVTPATTAAALVVAMGDWQVGKGENGTVEQQLDRFEDMIGRVEDRWRTLKKQGVPLTTLYPCFGGDLFEACSGHYAQQAFRTTLNTRDQRKVIRWAIDRALDRWSRFAPEVHVKVVGGNHGEEREAGKSHTDFADNKDVAVVEDVAYAYAKNPDRYGHVTFAIPNEDLTATFQHGTTIVGLAHGHQAGFGSGDPRTKIHNWWRGQMDGQQPIGDADILVSFHYHHPWMIRRGARTHFGCPAFDGGSDWFTNQTGMNAPPGTLTFVLDGSGWSGMEILDVRAEPAA